jgi:hypothetical protein
MNYTKLEQWRKATLELAAVKELEMALRKELFADGFMAPVEGTNLIELQDGWNLKATLPYTRSLDQAKVEETLKLLKKAKAPITLIKTKYELSVTDYKKLDDTVRGIVDTIITTKPGTPAMELVPPKGM